MKMQKVEIEIPEFDGSMKLPILKIVHDDFDITKQRTYQCQPTQK